MGQLLAALLFPPPEEPEDCPVCYEVTNAHTKYCKKPHRCCEECIAKLDICPICRAPLHVHRSPVHNELNPFIHVLNMMAREILEERGLNGFQLPKDRNTGQYQRELYAWAARRNLNIIDMDDVYWIVLRD